ncbi:MAG: methionyl-tRNA formyltransferase [Butyricicoccus sp.]|uniref:methionyl-tRNA formyltransferase n=1 Tax=Agathobaculum sp. TaxID=2048138 RepID=UPI0022E4EE04|nr:methionyl-tRNA formyltransferase [Butyricicoccus sp.]MDD6469755.1 methionyl-tRNA formyltransferase [Butyricicoccus sp.]MDY5958030.1 methionyl-tRNA formyltransferase [Agathobaculum butyriciproducens]MEE0154983.1 methionyl-tRNA formyltransferase [Agathobaculum butyriciproducens]
MRIVFMGTPDFAVPSLQALIDAGHDVCAVYTQPDKPQGRKQILTAPPVKTLALEHDIPVFQPNTLKNEDEQARLRELAPEVIIVVAYGKLLPKAVLDIPPHGCINVHGSLLPRWRGAAPIQWAVIAGDEMAGVTTMQMAEGLDTGDMLLTYETKVGEKETAGELFDRLAQSGAELLTQTLVKLDEITPRPQDDAQSCYAHMLDKQMAVIDWSKSAHEIDCLIRGLNPWPIALTTLSGERLKVFAAEKAAGNGEPGTVLEADPKKGLTVACGEGALKLIEIQLVGGKRMKATDFLRGHVIEVGTKLGDE